MKFEIQVSFISKPSEIVKVEAFNHREALRKVVSRVDSSDKENVIGTQITYFAD